jgi:hypothetical protein
LDVFAACAGSMPTSPSTFLPHNPAFPDTNFKADEDLQRLHAGRALHLAAVGALDAHLRGDGSWGDTAGTWGASAVVTYASRARLLGLRLPRCSTAISRTTIPTSQIRMSGFEVGYGFRF